MSEPKLILYGTEVSGHAHRVEALLGQLALPFEYRDCPTEVRRSESYRQMAPLDQIPVLSDGERVIADSGAILVDLARSYDRDGRWLPRELEFEVEVQRWLAVAAGDIRFSPALARLIKRFGVQADIAMAQRVALDVIVFMETHLDGRDRLAGERPTIDDVACYPYIAVADERGLRLYDHPRVTNWVARVEAIPNFVKTPR